jgi:hypothetical protein
MLYILLALHGLLKRERLEMEGLKREGVKGIFFV